MLLEDSIEVGLGGIYSKGNSSPSLRMDEDGKGGQEELSLGEGSNADRGLGERLARALQGVGERS